MNEMLNASLNFINYFHFRRILRSENVSALKISNFVFFLFSSIFLISFFFFTYPQIPQRTWFQYNRGIIFISYLSLILLPFNDINFMFFVVFRSSLLLRDGCNFSFLFLNSPVCIRVFDLFTPLFSWLFQDLEMLLNLKVVIYLFRLLFLSRSCCLWSSLISPLRNIVLHFIFIWKPYKTTSDTQYS